MDLVQFALVIIVVGVLLWLVNDYIPMDSQIKRILNIVVVIALIIWILKVFGLLSFLRGIRIGR
ncbi:MAG: Thivi_2564 family membrane protein [Snowella sp.]|jgi:hypothetical protein|nr:Thivi_2564 family membrane protein [Snowella sp.]PZV26552.1 MAG: hypothetical protein DCF12_09015 [Snowella sp.]